MICRQIPQTLFAMSAILFVLLCNTRTEAGVIEVDDIILTEQASGRVLLIDSSGTLTVISSGGNLVNPIDATVTPSGDLFVVDVTATGRGAVIQIDPTTGGQTVVASGGGIDLSVGIASDASGNLYVTNQGTNTVVRIDGSSFTQTTVATSLPFNSPYGIQVSSSGELIVNNNPIGTEFILGVNSAGVTRTITEGNKFIEPIAFDLDAMNGIYLANQNDSNNFGNILFIDSLTGEQTVVATGGLITSPQDLAIDSLGNLFFTNQSTNQLIRIERDTLTQTVVSSNFTGILSGIDMGLGPVTSVPEPSSLLCAIGLAIALFARDKRHPQS